MPYQQASEHKVLGAILGSNDHTGKAREFWSNKIIAVNTRIQRVAHLPIAFQCKTRLIEGNAMALWKYVPLSCPLALGELTKVTRAIMRTLGNGTTRSPAVATEILFATQIRLHSAHPGYCH
eukprot:6457921-Amphidinium_carterae.1